MRLHATALLAGIALAGAGCNPNPFCLNCGNAGDGGGDGPVVTRDLALGPDLAGTQNDLATDDGMNMTGPDLACTQQQLMMDPNNCGKCGNVCSYANAEGLCQNGTCAMGPCLPNYYDKNKDPKDGCEYKCLMTNGGVEICDGIDNNCDGKVDEGFNLMTDVMNCGMCGSACVFNNANGTCANGQCAIAGCKACFKDLNANGADGCEYQCPVCPPAIETCNGKDDDCNGKIDDNVTDVGQPCSQFCPAPAPCVMNNSCAFKLSKCTNGCCGQCTPGATICAGGQKICQTGMGPSLEVCDGVDNNCDGQIDEGFNLASDPLNCGKCGTVCNLPNAVASCTNGGCTIAQCKLGFSDLDKNPANGCEYQCPVNPPSIEVCNGKDDNCDGVVDNGVVSPPNFCNQTSICAGAKPVCCGASGWLCNYPNVNAHIEVTGVTMCQNATQGANIKLAETLCDGFDGNCNGFVDETWPNKGQSCTVGNGVCAGVGTYVCSNNNLTTVCSGTANSANAVDELCDGLDNDCDGQIDERVPMGNPTCQNGGAHACKGWVDPMVKVGAVYVYQYEASHPDAAANKVGVNTARACSNANVLPWTSVTETQAQAACAAVKDSMGKPMRLCTAPEWTTACDLAMANGKVWSYAANPTVYQSKVCNNADNNLAAPWATGSGASCYANQANGKLYDMSGNVAEWTSTTVTSNNVTYYKTRGGAYNSTPNGIDCNFDFTIEVPGYEFSDLGFRCCADNAP